MSGAAWAQYPGWQQKADYTMEIDLDVVRRTFSGSSEIRYTNASPDTLMRLYFHLFFNAFRPGSAMDVRSRMLPDPDPRVGARIAGLAGPLAEFFHGQRPPIASAEEGLATLRMTLACYISTREGRRVRIDEQSIQTV